MSPLEILSLSSSESSSTETSGGRHSERAPLTTVLPPSSLSAHDKHQNNDCIEASESVSCSDVFATEACLAHTTPKESPERNVTTTDSTRLFLEPCDACLDQAVWNFGAHADLSIQEMEKVSPAEGQLLSKGAASPRLQELELLGIRASGDNVCASSNPASMT